MSPTDKGLDAGHLLTDVADQRQRELAVRYYRDVPDGRIHGLMRRASEIHLLRWLARAVESCCDPALVAAPPPQWPAAGTIRQQQAIWTEASERAWHCLWPPRAAALVQACPALQGAIDELQLVRVPACGCQASNPYGGSSDG